MLERFCLFFKYNSTFVTVLFIICATIISALTTPSIAGAIVIVACTIFVYGVLSILSEDYLSARKVRILYEVKEHLTRE